MKRDIRGEGSVGGKNWIHEGREAIFGLPPRENGRDERI